MKKCVICENELDGSKTKYCSNKCKAKGHYQNRKNDNSYHSQTIRGLKRKLKLIELKGGCCNKCGYFENISALEFNHLCCKNFALDLRALSNIKWETLIDEVKNCNLLCANCHREYHNPELNITNINNILLNSNIKEIRKYKSICKNCNTPFKKVTGKIYCSSECRKMDSKLPSILEINNKYNELRNWEKVAKYFNITSKTIRLIRKL